MCFWCSFSLRLEYRNISRQLDIFIFFYVGSLFSPQFFLEKRAKTPTHTEQESKDKMSFQEPAIKIAKKDVSILFSPFSMPMAISSLFI